MKINKLKINSYGKLKEKEIKFEDKINIIYGKNEAGKTTILKFITNSFYGISKNKNGKETSDFEKYMPWVGEEFSGKIEYELDNKEKYEIFRNFKKKNPQIFNEKKEDILKQYNIDKSKGSEFFYEQTKMDEELFLSTVLVNQQEVKLGKQEQNVLIQKIANLVGTGEDKVSFKRAIERIDRRKLEEIGTERSREKPINILNKEINKLKEKKQELEKYEKIKYEIEENKNQTKNEIEEIENENNFLKEIKIIIENEKIEEEKINLKTKIEKESEQKIRELKNKRKEINIENENTYEKGKKIKLEKSKTNKKTLIALIIVIIINILQFNLIKNKYLNYIILLIIPIVLIFYIISRNKIKNKEEQIKSKIEKVKVEINNLNSEKKVIEENKKKIENEINEMRNNFNIKIKLEKEQIKNKYIEKIEKEAINKLAQTKELNLEIQKRENEINGKKIKLHTLEIDSKQIEPQLENLSNIEEKIVENNEKIKNLKNLEKSMNIAKEILSKSYEEMKNTVTPKFTEELSKTIAKITNNKYKNVRFNDEVGLVIETEDGNYIKASRLSIGTIDQLYLSLRIAMVDELSKEKMPLILDEAFAYYDEQRLKNILEYISKRFNNHQIIIFTCTKREKEILEELDIKFKFIEI